MKEGKEKEKGENEKRRKKERGCEVYGKVPQIPHARAVEELSAYVHEVQPQVSVCDDSIVSSVRC